MQESKIVFICIGSNKIVGDSLGPLVGTYLKKKFCERLYKNILVYGDLYEPVNFNNINQIIEMVEKYNKEYIKILIDSARGENTGEIIINTGDIYIGEGLDKAKKIDGDIYIKGIIGKNYNTISKNIIELRQQNFYMIDKMAKDIVKIINV